MTAAARLREWLPTTLARPSTLVALALVVVGFLFMLAELLSPSRLYWTGDAVTGTNSGGIVYYQVDGEDYTLNAPGAAPAQETPVTVYVDPDEPGQALISRPTRWVDAGAVLVWFVAAGACVVVSALRRTAAARRQRQADLTGPTFGDGLGSDLVERYLEQNRRPPTRPPPS
jgi:hypothetical protein